MMISVVITVAILALIFVQDILSRSIWWFLPPLLFVSLLWNNGEHIEWKSIGYNLLFVSLIFSTMLVYIRMRFGSIKKTLSHYFGLGDALFILAITPLVAFPSYIYFFTAGTIFTLLLHGIVYLIRRQKNIPYAGYFSLFTATYIILNSIQPISIPSFFSGQ